MANTNITPMLILEHLNDVLKDPIVPHGIYNRKRGETEKRALPWKLCREFSSCSFDMISKVTGHNHATIIHGINNIFPLLEIHRKDLYEHYEHVKEILENINRGATKEKFQVAYVRYIRANDRLNEFKTLFSLTERRAMIKELDL